MENSTQNINPMSGLFNGEDKTAKAIHQWMDENAPELATQLTWRSSQDIYSLYKQGVLSAGLEPYAQGQTKILDYMVENSVYPRTLLSVWLYALVHLAEVGEVERKYWDPRVKAAEPGIIETVIEKSGLPGAGKGLENITKNIKWIGVIAIIGVAIYFTYPVLRKIRNRK